MLEEDGHAAAVSLPSVRSVLSGSGIVEGLPALSDGVDELVEVVDPQAGEVDACRGTAGGILAHRRGTNREPFCSAAEPLISAPQYVRKVRRELLGAGVRVESVH